MLDPGDRLTITYPDSTLVNAMSNLQRRQIQVHRVRDLVAEPLTPVEYFRRPMLRRSRWLVHAWDEQLEAWRKFYLGSTREYSGSGHLRIALYEPDSTKPFRIISRGFQERPRERILLARTLRSLQRMDLDDLQIRIIADDLRRVG